MMTDMSLVSSGPNCMSYEDGNEEGGGGGGREGGGGCDGVDSRLSGAHVGAHRVVLGEKQVHNACGTMLF